MDGKPVDLNKTTEKSAQESVTGSQTGPAADPAAEEGATGSAGPSRSNRAARAGRPAAAPLPKIPIPFTVHLATIAIGVQIVCNLGRALALRGYTGELSDWLREMNTKAKKPVADYTPAKVAHDLEQLRSGSLVQAVVIAVALAILAVSLRRVRGASGARWALLIILVLTSGPLSIMPVSGWPLLPKVLGVGIGVASIAVIILILLPQSTAYFRACKDAVRPPSTGQRPTGLASLFLPKPRPGQPARGGAATRGGAAPARAATSAARSDSPVRRTPKAKVRADAESVARGAELARARAKASKSRRTGEQ